MHCPTENYMASAKYGTAGGTALVFLSNINGGDLLKTMVLAATGAAVSFIVSFALKWLAERKK